MRPLSTGNYFRHNKRKLISNTFIIIAAICLVYIMECFIASIVQSIYPLDAARFKYCSVLVSTETLPEIPQEVIDSLESSQHIQAAVPVTIREMVFSVPGSTTHTAVFAADSNDQTYLIDKFQAKVEKGRLPDTDADEIALDNSVAKNNHLQIGSKTEMDKSHNLDRQYTVVGILESDSHISIVGSPVPNSSTLNDDESGYLVFPRKGHRQQAESETTSLSNQGLTVWTLSLYNKLYEKNNQTFQILDTMIILAIIVMSICLVCSKYAQYCSRKSEIGTLYALGYTQKEITNRIFYEVAATNVLGLIAGLTLAILLCRFFVASYFESIGGTGVYLYGKAGMLALLAPTITTVSTLIPVYRLIRRVDAVSIIETN